MDEPHITPADENKYSSKELSSDFKGVFWGLSQAENPR